MIAVMVAPRGRPTTPLLLTEEERSVLERWSRRGRTAQALVLRSRIVLGCTDGKPSQDVARQLGTSPQTVCKWRARFLASRLEGLEDEFRPGAPRKITDEMVERVVVKTLEEMPRDATHWSVRSIGQGNRHVVRGDLQGLARLRAAAPPHRHLQALQRSAVHRQGRDIVGLYLDPPEAALVLCVDEKAQIQALDRTQPILPILPTTPARRSHDDVRNGTSSLFAALDVASGKVISAMHRRHHHQEFLKFLKTIDASVPAELDVQLICDTYGTHKTPEIRRWLLRHPRFHLHLTPTYSSWLNLVERWFAELTNRKLRRSAHRSVA